MATIQKIAPCLWFDHQAEEAAQFYTGVFPSSRIVQVARYPKAGQEVHGRAAGSVMIVKFELAGIELMALNGGPQFKFTEAISLMVNCESQEEIDFYWSRLGEGGDPQAQMCGWLKDRYGLSWQIAPADIGDYYLDHDSTAAARVMTAMMGMRKLDIAALRAARGC
jgi:predicted 3-demethylubiquinone-9 3-methyltransferase (glyoxalase superfamily)